MAIIIGNFRNNVLNGTNRSDAIFGAGGNDRIGGKAGDDLLDGGAGRDHLTGGRGDDWIFGGIGFDTAAFDGSVLDYRITRSGSMATVTDLSGDEGTDILSSVEALQFSDVTVYLDGRNNAPFAVSDTVGAGEDASSVVEIAGLLENDRDFDGNALRLVGVDTTATQGAVTDNGNGTLTYDPGTAFQHLGAGETATDSFTYRISDGRGGTDTATVTVRITGANDAPIAADDAATTTEDAPLAASAPGVLANDTDVDANDGRTVTAVNGAAASVGQQITLASGALLTLDANGGYVYDPNGAFESLAAGQSATDSFTYTVSDGKGGSDDAVVTITITGVTDAPETVPNIDLGALNGGGFKIVGEIPDDVAGSAVSSAGDLNGDGFDDIIVGARLNDAGGYNAGAAYVVFGKADGFGTIDLDDVAAGTGGFKIVGEAAGDEASCTVSAAGDVNGDGFDDLIVGALGNNAGGDNAGAAYVVLGKAGGFGTINLDDVAAGTTGLKIVGESALDIAGLAVSGAGDVNGDGFDDLLVGAPLNDAGGNDAGAAYVVFGSAGGAAMVNLDDVAAGTGGFKIIGEATNHLAGYSVAGAGDVNNDGFDDVIVGAHQSAVGAALPGAAYVVFGAAVGTGTVNLDDVAAGTGGFKIVGEDAFDDVGVSVSGAGDVNGDGFDDLLVGASENSAGGGAGAAYVVFGKGGGFGTVDLDAVAAGSGGFKIVGENADDRAGFSVSGAGDVNGDGLADLLIGADLNAEGGDEAGAAYLVFGKSSGLGMIDLDEVAQGFGGFKIIGEPGDQAGHAVAAAGDVNGDGFDDLLVGAHFDHDRGAYAGAAYVLFGSDFTGAGAQSADLQGGDILL